MLVCLEGGGVEVGSNEMQIYLHGHLSWSPTNSRICGMITHELAPYRVRRVVSCTMNQVMHIHDLSWLPTNSRLIVWYDHPRTRAMNQVTRIIVCDDPWSIMIAHELAPYSCIMVQVTKKSVMPRTNESCDMIVHELAPNRVTWVVSCKMIQITNMCHGLPRTRA